MLRFGVEPLLIPLQQPRKKKAARKYKGQRDFRPKQEEHRTWSERPDATKESIKAAIRRHISKIQEGKTPSHRRQHRDRKRALLRAKYKMLNKMRTCTHCNVSRPITDFDLQKDSTHPAHQRRPYCMFCRKKKNREYYLKRKQRDT